MIKDRPEFDKIKSYDEFKKYYWYREELIQICKNLKIEDKGSKQELNDIIKEYFSGNIIKKSKTINNKKEIEKFDINSPLLKCGFAFNDKFREYFSELTKIKPFKFTADMAFALKKVRKEQKMDFTIKDMLDVYYGNSNYAKYDNSSCQWNKFFKEFCEDSVSKSYSNKLKVASILWNEVKNSTNEKKYSRELLETNKNKIIKYKRKS